MILDKEEQEKLTKLLEDVRVWILANDYETTWDGGYLYDRCGEAIDTLDSGRKV